MMTWSVGVFGSLGLLWCNMKLIANLKYIAPSLLFLMFLNLEFWGHAFDTLTFNTLRFTPNVPEFTCGTRPSWESAGCADDRLRTREVWLNMTCRNCHKVIIVVNVQLAADDPRGLHMIDSSATCSHLSETDSAERYTTCRRGLPAK